MESLMASQTSDALLTMLVPSTGEMLRVAWSAVGAVGGTGLVVAAGYILAWLGWITPESNKDISKITLYFFTGCLMFFNLGDAITPEIFAELWPIPIFVAANFVVCWILSKIGCYLLRIRQHENWVTASIMFSNSNNFPVAVVYALVYEDHSRLQVPGQKLPKIDILTRGLSYVFVYALFSNLVRWSYGYNLLAKPAAASPPAPPATTITHSTTQPLPTQQQQQQSQLPPALSNSRRNDSTRSDVNRRKSVGMGTDESQVDYDDYDDEGPIPVAAKRRPTRTVRIVEEARPLLADQGGFVQEPSDIESNSGGNHTNSQQHQPQAATMDPPEPEPVVPSLWTRLSESDFGKAVGWLAGPFANPPMVASLAGILFGLVTPLKNLIFGNEAPFKGLIAIPLRNCGEASVPLTLVGLGSTLRKTLLRQSSLHQHHPSAGHPQGVGKAVAYVLVVRLLVMGAVGVAAIFVARRMGVALAKEDPLFCLVMLILASSPTAVNLAQIAAVGGAHEEELSLCLLWMYGAALPLQIAACAGYLVFVGDYLKFVRPGSV